MNDLARKLKSQASEEIIRLRNKNNNQQVSTNFDAVWVFSGPGTIKQPLKEGDNPLRKWMDRDRILYGAELITKITAMRLHKTYNRITRNDILNSGPFLIYNGIPRENADFREVLQSPSCLLPYEKVYIVDEVFDKNVFYPIKNTLDQIKSFPKAFLNNGLIKERIAIVSHAEHFPRILRYIKKYNIIPEHIKITVFPLKSAREVENEYYEEEVNKVWEYFQKGNLSWSPIPTEENFVMHFHEFYTLNSE